MCAIRIPPVLLFWFYTACTYDILQVILSIFLPNFTNLHAACSLFNMPVLVMFVLKRLDVLILQLYNRLIFCLIGPVLWWSLSYFVFWMICPIFRWFYNFTSGLFFEWFAPFCDDPWAIFDVESREIFARCESGLQHVPENKILYFTSVTRRQQRPSILSTKIENGKFIDKIW